MTLECAEGQVITSIELCVGRRSPGTGSEGATRGPRGTRTAGARRSCRFTSAEVNAAVGDPCPGHHKRVAVAAAGCAPVPQPQPPLSRVHAFSPALFWDTADGASGPVPHSRYIGASPMAADIGATDVWYWGNASGGGRALHPSSRLWGARDGGAILDDDGVGGVSRTPAAACAIAGGNLEVWHAALSGGRHAVALFNRSPRAAPITATWAALGLPPDRRMEVRDVWEGRDVGTRTQSYSADVPAYSVAFLTLRASS
eukprot:gene22122-43016_t